eukprot:gb/GECG01006187.1/.p1 GENE.gb/GECG01006187.1/~~gb/GECG01006187.1/.p1  ORF type:complete len:157 (+),score=24.66 gb/GECG01006187.1/:1-471(+)
MHKNSDRAGTSTMKWLAFTNALVLCLLALQVNGESDIMCTEDARQCGDGSAVRRDPENNCEFRRCPEDKSADNKRQLREDKFDHARNRLEQLRQRMRSRLSTEEDVMCTADVKKCPDGTDVSRTPPNCEFKLCPDGTRLSSTQHDDIQTFSFPGRT